MKIVLIVLLTLLTASCGIVPDLTPGITPLAYNQAQLACKDRGGVHMITQTMGIGTDYDVYCNNGNKRQL